MESILNKARNFIPILNNRQLKGENGNMGVIGGCLEYTGAPFYGSISQLYGGADLSHIFCTKNAGIPIKSYSPEVIVHSYLISLDDTKI